jgi:hypothetical protein
LLLYENDPDKSVDLDERLTITAVEPVRYDIKLGDRKSRVCVVRSVEVKSGRLYAYSSSDKDPIRCEP